MRKTKSEKEDFQEFSDFIAADPLNPRAGTDEALRRMVGRSLRPPLWTVLGKLTLVEAAAGLGTLAVCPQFDIGFGPHNAALHSLHALTGPLPFYLSCGIFFVLFGAALSGIMLNRAETRVLGKRRYAYFIAYSACAYAIFMALGAEVLLLGSLAWIAGAVLGNTLGFAMGKRLRTALN